MRSSKWRDRVAPARLGKAVMLVVAVQLLVTAWTGVMAAPDGGQAEVPATFSEPPVRTGDRAVYAVETPDGQSLPEIRNRTLVRVAVEWAGPQWSLTEDGSHRWTMALDIFLDLDDPESGSTLPGNTESEKSFDMTSWVHYDAETWTSTGTSDELRFTETSEYASVRRQSLRSSAQAKFWTMDLDEPMTPCGFHLPFHGEEANLSGALEPVGDCGGAGLRAVAVEDVAKTKALRLASPDDASVQVWYAPEIPLPVRWSGPLSGLAIPTDGAVTLELSSWERGDGPTADRPSNDRPGPLSVPTAPRKAWGPAERNLENVSLRLSTAYGILAEDGDVQAFLDDHPDAYTARAWIYRDRDAANRPRTTWQFVLTDADDHVERFVVRSDPIPVPGTDRRVAPPAEVTTRDDAPKRARKHAPEPADRYPDPSRLATHLPVVGPQAMPEGTDGGYAPWEGGYAVHYGLSTACADADCTEPTTIVEVGTEVAPRRQPSDPDPTWAKNKSARRFGLTPAGDVAYVKGMGKTGGGPKVAGDEKKDGGSPAPAARIDGGPLPVPSREAAAGISLAAVLVGALYYLWPKVKLVGAGLYSRIGTDRDEVLDNDVRRRIHEMVRSEPGIHFREIKRRLDTGVGVLEHHLEKLVRADLLAEQRTEAYRCYFPYGEVDRRVMDAAKRLRSASARDVLRAVLERPGASVTDLAEATDLSRSTAGYHLQRLAEAGLVDKDRDGRGLDVRLTDLGHRAVEDLGLA